MLLGYIEICSSNRGLPPLEEVKTSLGPLRTLDWEPVTITLQALHWWKRRSWSKFASHYTWGTNGVCECKMYVKSTWHQMDRVSWSLGRLFSKPPLGGWLNTILGDHGTPNTHNPLINSTLSCVRTHMNRNSSEKHLAEGPITYGFTLHLRVREQTTWSGRCVRTALGHFLLGTHNFMVTALGSWALHNKDEGSWDGWMIELYVWRSSREISSWMDEVGDVQ